MSEDSGRLAVVVVAAGQSTRMDGVDKQITLLRGEPVISHSLRVFENSNLVGPVVLVMSAENLEAGRTLSPRVGFRKLSQWSWAASAGRTP